MSGHIKFVLIIAAVLVAIGLAIFVVTMSINKWNFAKLSTTKYESISYEIKENFADIRFKIDSAHVTIEPTIDGVCKLAGLKAENVQYNVVVQDGVLDIQSVDKRLWYEYIGFSFGYSELTLYIPEENYASLMIEVGSGDVDVSEQFHFDRIHISSGTGDVTCCASVTGSIDIKANTGSVRLNKLSAGSINLKVSTGDVVVKELNCDQDVQIEVSTGKVNLYDVECMNFTSSGSTGNIKLQQVIATGKITVQRSSGDVRFDSCDAAELYVKVTTGSVKGTLLTEKIFQTKTTTGSVRVPQSLTGGKCEIITSTGDVAITIQ